MSTSIPFDITALEHSSDAAGKFLETLGKTDLRTMTKREWMDFLTIICQTYRLKFDESQLELGPVPF